MSSIRAVVRSLAVALTFAVAAAPAVAMAEGKSAPAGEKGGEHGKHKGDRKREEIQFPVTAQKFQEMVEKRLTKSRDRLNHMMEKRNVPEATRAQVRKELDAGAAAIREAAKKAGADGTVTREEAKQVKDLAKDLKNKAKAKLGISKEKRGTQA
ncbi:hypothetical protein [Chondromyces apiculatus]|uniref:Uncharacterized protein n=1 Tax=Chondromyces apiculatus DSM 436 TaxID=1192034 RepID=A0A017TF55_9BACT|nr:hypothetical protein [Chondromyces apiculatus]EYF07236.1 Hypothetical protein CAP_0715 [Chondromyces apiculatus DSM 436]